MKGYKIAVGVDKVKGPFEVMVELEIPETSIVIVPDCDSRGKKRRTDKAIVEKIYPIDEVVENWNGKAYSLTNLSTYLYNRIGLYPSKEKLTIDVPDDIFVYETGKEVRSRLCEDTFTDCAEGIHFYTTKKDALELIKPTEGISYAVSAFCVLKEDYRHSDDIKRWYQILIDNI